MKRKCNHGRKSYNLKKKKKGKILVGMKESKSIDFENNVNNV